MPTVKYVFRYRDLIAATLEEHRRIIKARGTCWWGWWKRPLEPARMEVWEDLERQLQSGPVWVGLFDSGGNKSVGNKCYLAKVGQVIRPKLDSSGKDCEPLPVPPGEEELVPEYYRLSPFSRAWMRLAEINGELQLFGKDGYAYASAPPLENVEPSQLKAALAGKLIANGAELRAMDTTIWEVMPATQGAAEHEVLTFSARLTPALSGAPILLKHASFLHITDPHFSLKPHDTRHAWKLENEKGAKPTLADAIHSALTRDHISIGAAIVTGDLTFVGSRDEFGAAFSSLYSLLGKLNLGVENLVVVPGNHDIRWTTDEVYEEGRPVKEAPDTARQNYADFFHRIFRQDPDDGLCMARRYVTPNGVVIEVAALNSSSLEQGKNYLAGMGRIDEHTFTKVANVLGWQPGSPSRALRVLALHHHLAPTENVEPADGYLKGFGMAIDAPRVQRMAAEHGVQLALHGHKHRAFLWRSNVFELPEERGSGYRGDLAICGGGSAGSTDRPNNRNYFSVFTVKPDRLEMILYKSEDGNPFGQIGRWFMEFNVLPSGHMMLGSWREGPKEGDG